MVIFSLLTIAVTINGQKNRLKILINDIPPMNVIILLTCFLTNKSY